MRMMILKLEIWSLRNWILILHETLKVFFQPLKAIWVVVDILTKRLRKTASFTFLFNHLQQVVYHLTFIFKMRRHLSVRHCPKRRYLMAGIVKRPILVEPYFDISLNIEPYQLPVYMKRPHVLIQLLKRSAALFQNVQTLSKTKLWNIA